MPSAARAVSPSMRKSGSRWGKTRTCGASANWGRLKSGGGGAVPGREGRGSAAGSRGSPSRIATQLRVMGSLRSSIRALYQPPWPGAGRWRRAVSGTLFPDGGGGDAHQEQQEAQLPEVTGKDLPRHRLLHAHQLEQDEELVEDGDPGGRPATPVRQPNQAC